MSKKPSKSIQAIIITLIAGMIIPKIFDISGNALLDKFLWKGVLSASFSVATIIVGLLYAGKFITGKVAGGKSRISIYFILIAIFASAASAVCAFVREISPIIKMALASVTILAITLLIAKLIGFCFKVKRDFKITQERSVAKKESSTSVLPVSKDPTVEKKVSADAPTIASNVGKCSAQNIQISSNSYIVGDNENEGKTLPLTIASNSEEYSVQNGKMSSNSYIVSGNENEGKTLFELWDEKDINEKCLTATNDENPDLKWVKIYKPPYPNGKFYGYVMMCNAHNTVNGEIYFADRSIWRRC